MLEPIVQGFKLHKAHQSAPDSAPSCISRFNIISILPDPEFPIPQPHTRTHTSPQTISRNSNLLTCIPSSSSLSPSSQPSTTSLPHPPPPFPSPHLPHTSSAAKVSDSFQTPFSFVSPSPLPFPSLLFPTPHTPFNSPFPIQDLNCGARDFTSKCSFIGIKCDGTSVVDIEARAGRPGGVPADPVVAGQCVEACSCRKREEATDMDVGLEAGGL